MGNVLSSLWQEGHNPNIRHLGRESWNWLPAQPEPKIATYLQSIIESLRFYSPGSFNSQLPSSLLTISVGTYNTKQTGGSDVMMANSIGCIVQITVKRRNRLFHKCFHTVSSSSPQKQEVFLVRRNIGQAPYLPSGFLRQLGGNCQTS